MSDANVAMVWGHLKTAVARNPALGVVLALLVPLAGAAAVFLAPFATPLMIAYYVKTRRARADADTGVIDADNDGASVASVVSSASAAKPPAATPPASSAAPSPAEPAAADLASAAPAPLTGSAALMAKMRKSGAVTGEKRAKDSSSAAVASRASDAPGAGAAAPTSDLADPNGSRLFFLHGGEASVQIARDLAEKANARGFDPRVVAMDDFKRCRLDERPAVAIFVVETVEKCATRRSRRRVLAILQPQAQSRRSRFPPREAPIRRPRPRRHQPSPRSSDDDREGLQPGGTDARLGVALFGRRAGRRAVRANDAVGLEEAVEPWCESLWAPLADAMAAVDASTGGSNDASGAPRARVRFLFGSQTGNAAEICKAMAAEASSERGVDAVCCSMNETDVGDVLKPGNVVVYVVSSTGDGDAPDNCDAYFTRLKRGEEGARRVRVGRPVRRAGPRRPKLLRVHGGASKLHHGDGEGGRPRLLPSRRGGRYPRLARVLREVARGTVGAPGGGDCESPGVRREPGRGDPGGQEGRHQESERRDDVDRRRDAVDRRARRRSRASRVSRGGGVARRTRTSPGRRTPSGRATPRTRSPPNVPTSPPSPRANFSRTPRAIVG